MDWPTGERDDVDAIPHIGKQWKIAAALVLAATVVGRGQVITTSPQPRIIDLTHTLDQDFPYIPVPGITFPFKLTPIATMEQNGVAANRWDIHEHIGTQIDAPSHFARGGAGLDGLPVEALIVPLVVIDISARAQADPDTAVTVADIAAWETRHGRLPDGAAVLMYSGWETRLRQSRAFVNADAGNTMHFPGFSLQAAEFLARDRQVSGIGVDTISIDPGNDKEFRTHKAWLGSGKWAVEAVANLQQVPATGATLFVGAPRVKGATGGPVRLLAMSPAPAAAHVERPGQPPTAAAAAGDDVRSALRGLWEHERCQVQERDGRRTSSRSLFAIFDREWGVAFTQYADGACRARVMTAVLRGTYEPTAPSRQTQGAVEVTFRFSRKSLVAHDAALLERLNAGGCGGGRWEMGVARDITSTGCLSIESLAACPQEYDLARIDGDRLYLGERPRPGTNICAESRRPHALRTEPLRRR